MSFTHSNGRTHSRRFSTFYKMNYRYVARLFAMIGARSSGCVVAFSPHLRARELARSRENSQTSNLPPDPHILTRHRSTAELRIAGIENSRTESLTEEPSPWSNDLAMSHLRIRETNISPCVGLAHYLNVCTRKKRNCCSLLLYTAALL